MNIEMENTRMEAEVFFHDDGHGRLTLNAQPCSSLSDSDQFEFTYKHWGDSLVIKRADNGFLLKYSIVDKSSQHYNMLCYGDLSVQLLRH